MLVRKSIVFNTASRVAFLGSGRGNYWTHRRGGVGRG